MEAWNGLPLLELDSIVGPIQCVAEALRHCANRELTISITGETNASSLQIYGPVFQSFSVATLLVRLRPCAYDVVQSLAAFFPFVSRLEIFEKVCAPISYPLPVLIRRSMSEARMFGMTAELGRRPSGASRDYLASSCISHSSSA